MLNSAEILVYGYVYGEPKQPSLKYPKFITFSLSVTEKYKDKINNEEKKIVTWYECQTSKDWLQEVITKHIKQGMGLAVRGIPKYEAYLDKEGALKVNVKININDLKILTYPKQEENNTDQKYTTESLSSVIVEDDEIPF